MDGVGRRARGPDDRGGDAKPPPFVSLAASTARRPLPRPSGRAVDPQRVHRRRRVIYAARPASDDCVGVHGACRSVAAFKQSMALLGAARDRAAAHPPGAGPLHRPRCTSGLRLAGPL
ncbi:hypothetical protein MICRO80W_790013 [Micrococcus luteus]|nr:hypothetical protein MICRO116_280004 [Micrococcus sp. 116]VWX52345.1 hypothetical protein MICRO80W_790013 [Micrococcus luteus]VXB66785.1 hypothetical protein MICRO11B_460016 [Micrococcus luteus]